MRRTIRRSMPTRAVALLVVCAVLQYTPVYAQTPAAAPGATPDAAVSSAEAYYVPGRLIVGIDPNVVSLQAAGALAALDAQVIHASDPCVAGIAAAGDSTGQTAVQTWQVAPGQEEEAIAVLREQPGVSFVTRDVYMYAAQEEVVEPASRDAADLAAETVFTVDDPLYTSHQWGPQRANLARAWQMLPPGEGLSTIRVAVIDSGVDFGHPDLAGRLLPGKNYFYTNTLPTDENGHGTHVTGVIAALTNNGAGMAGSAIKVQIDPRKVLDAKGNGSAVNLRYAVCDAARDGARVINMSVQIPPTAMPPSSSLYKMLKEAMVFAAERGVLLVAAGGNSRLNPQVYYPALFDEVVAVASTTIDNQRPDYGPIGTKVEIAAPGGDEAAPILSTWPSALRNSCPLMGPVQSGGGWYCGDIGTSMASPLVAGGAAMVLSVQPSLTAAEVRAILTQTAVDVGLPANVQGAGLLNVEGALRSLLRSQLAVTLTGASASAAYGSAPYTATLVLSNPSLDPLAVTGIVTGSSWLSVTGMSGQTFAGTLRYGQPLAMPLVISPTNLMTGTYTGQIQLTATRSDGSVISSKPTVIFAVGKALPPPIYFPLVLVAAVPQQSSAALAFSWETPISPTVYALTSTESVDVALPFAFPLSGPAGSGADAYTQVRIHADGFVSFPDAATAAILDPGQNRCLPWSPGGMQGVFGWWADLNAAASGAEVSSFRPASNRFVVQYKNLPSAGMSPQYQVTFQIVLYSNGDVQLNYLQAPQPWSPSFGQMLPLATAGVQARNGLYRNQAACATGRSLVGVLPQSGQSLRIRNGEVY